MEGILNDNLEFSYLSGYILKYVPNFEGHVRTVQKFTGIEYWVCRFRPLSQSNWLSKCDSQSEKEHSASICHSLQSRISRTDLGKNSTANIVLNSVFFQCLFKHYKCITGVVVQKRHNGPCAGEERLTDKDFFNGPLVKDRLSHQSFRFL